MKRDKESNSTASSSENIFVKESSQDPIFKTVGLILALSSGLFIGASFIFKKKGLLQASKPGAAIGEGYSYLSNGLWWFGMTLMIIGEMCNFIAYAFTQAILVTPLGALSVVISAVLSSIFLKERLNMHGKIGCAQCIFGAIIILMHAPDQQTANTIDEFEHLFIQPLFLVYVGLAILGSIIVRWKIAPKYGSKNMLVYIGICSLIGSLSVVATQGFGRAVITSFMGENQFKHWFLYFLGAFVIVTLLTQLNYLNKALNLFNTAMVTPVYYVTFTSMTMVSSAILFQGFTAPPVNIVSVVLGFLVICSGIVLLQTSKNNNGDGRGEGTYSHDQRISMASDVSLEPGASEFFGSIRRYSMHHGRTHPAHSSIVQHRRSMSLSFGGYPRRGSTNDNNNHNIDNSSNILSIIDEQSTSNISVPTNRDKGIRGKIDTTSTEISIAMGEIRFTESNTAIRTTPFIHATAPSISSSITTSPPSSPPQPQLILPPPLSPLQHPLNYLKKQLGSSSTAAPTPAFPEFTSLKHTSESYSGTEVDRKGSTASRRSQNKLSIIDKFKFGLHPGGGSSGGDDDNEDYEELVNKANVGGGSEAMIPVKKKGSKKSIKDADRKGGSGYGSEDGDDSSGSISPIE
ncbi:1055_t:CDS:2 [Ambispora gerdemannii]|uniref:1055_t:CDS:1 n=1 Tax=Ambispora gerdemannii TaxID=144530 RepID=A0A9N9B3L7_9GLOM|nr:1055_t:CDS:2 [Ambispora gerdemannii]